MVSPWCHHGVSMVYTPLSEAVLMKWQVSERWGSTPPPKADSSTRDPRSTSRRRSPPRHTRTTPESLCVETGREMRLPVRVEYVSARHITKGGRASAALPARYAQQLLARKTCEKDYARYFAESAFSLLMQRLDTYQFLPDASHTYSFRTFSVSGISVAVRSLYVSPSPSFCGNCVGIMMKLFLPLARLTYFPPQPCHTNGRRPIFVTFMTT